MLCAACRHANPDDARFCNACGQRLAVAAPPAPAREPHAYTPRHLAERILTSRSALEGERKQVTVLFADIHGSMELAERVDPEAWHRLLDRFFAICTDAVHRFDGTVNQYTGDGIMALFGAPLAHEDHAARACHAALQLREDLHAFAGELRRDQGLGLATRVGLNSGEVIVGKIGDDLRMDYTAQGHTVGLAQRVEQLAEPGRVYLTEHTAALVAGLFELRDLGRVALKGAREPVQVHELLRPGRLRTRFDQSRARGLSRFIGRDDQRARLDAALARAQAGDGSVVGIVGDAGVGKSRLCWELAERCRAEGITVAEGRGVAHGKTIPFLPLLEFLRSMFGVADDDPPTSARQKIAGALLLLDESFRAALPLVFDFLGVTDPTGPAARLDPARQRRDLIDFFTRLIPARARVGPGLVLCEDLHWIDPATDAVLAHLVASVPHTRTLVVLNFRPGYRAPWMDQAWYTEIALAPLGPEAVDALLAELLGRDPSCGALAAQIRERTGGNPFFVEEVVQSLVESGALDGVRGAHRLTRPVEQVTIPPTVHAVLASRIDRLAERDKRVLATAAVVGKEVRRSVLARVCELPEPDLDGALAALVAADLLLPGTPPPDPLFVFRHPLTQEVAYRTQLADRRTRTHAAVARAIGEQSTGRPGERAALLAHHWEAAGEPLEAADAHYRAAEWLAPRDSEGALRHCRRVCELLATVPESPETIARGILVRGRIVSLSARVGLPDAERATVLAEMRALAARTDDPSLLHDVASSELLVGGMSGDAETLVERMRTAVQLADQAGDVGGGIGLRFALAIALAFSGRLREALALIDATLATAPPDPSLGATTLGFSPAVALVMQRGLLLLHLGDPAESARTLVRAAELARAAGETEVLGWTRGAQSTLYWFVGDPGAALAHARAAVEIAHTVGGSLAVGQAYESLGQALLLAEQWDDAVAALEHAIAIAREQRTFFDDEAHLLSRLAEGYLGRGDVARACTTAAEAVGLAQQRRAGWAEGSTQIILARMLRHEAGPAARPAIETALAAAAASLARSGARVLEPFHRIEVAELARCAGDEAGWRRTLAEAHRLCTDLGLTGRAAMLAAQLGHKERHDPQ